MNQPRKFPKVASDLFFVQGTWAASFLGIMLIIQIVKIVMSSINENGMNTYFVATFIASNIFMLVIGIISSIGFIPYFVSNGVTRKDYFKGNIIGTMGLALCIPIVSAIVSSLLNFIINLLNLQVNIDNFQDISNEPEGHIIVDAVTSIIFSPYVELSSNWLLAILVFALNIFTYYLAGWLIGSAFSRLGVIGGLLSIAVGFIVVQIEDILLSESLGLKVPTFALNIDIPIIVSLIGILVVVVICLWLIRQLTKKITVKL